MTGLVAAPRLYDIFIGNVGPLCNNSDIVDVIHGLGINTDQTIVQEIQLKAGNGRKAFKAAVSYTNHPEVTAALMSCDQNLIVEKFRNTKQQLSPRQTNWAKTNNNFRGSNPNNKPYKQNRQHQHHSNNWNNQHWGFYGSPGWGYAKY